MYCVQSRQFLHSISWRVFVASALSIVLWPTAAMAHLMVAQHGTLNFVGNGAFMVMSLPASAFPEMDDDGDGKLSTAEFAKHQANIATAVTRGLQLSDAQGHRPLEGLMLVLSPSDEKPTEPADQLVVLGRFALGEKIRGLTLKLSLFGKAVDEKTQKISVTCATEQQQIVLTPENNKREVLPRQSGEKLLGPTSGSAVCLNG